MPSTKTDLVSLKKRRARVSTLLANLALSFLFFSLAFYIYEFSNYLALYLAGSNPQLSISSLFTLGVRAIGGYIRYPILLKLEQLLICSILVYMLYWLFAKTEFRYSKLCFIGVLSIYLSSFYWESLSLLGSIPLVIHELIYSVIVFVTTLFIFKTQLKNIREQ